MYPETINKLMEELKKLPGIGSRTAERLALYISRNHGRADALELAAAIRDVVEKTKCCSRCYNISESDPCAVCASADRETSKLLVVEGPGDLEAMEDAGWRGLYHVLQGALDPVEGVLPEHLTVNALLKRVGAGEVTEVILATNPDFEGDGTALMLAKKLEGMDVKVSRIARGIATGAKLEYASRAMLSDALSGRIPIER